MTFADPLPVSSLSSSTVEIICIQEADMSRAIMLKEEKKKSTPSISLGHGQGDHLISSSICSWLSRVTSQRPSVRLLSTGCCMSTERTSPFLSLSLCSYYYLIFFSPLLALRSSHPHPSVLRQEPLLDTGDTQTDWLRFKKKNAKTKEKEKGRGKAKT